MDTPEMSSGQNSQPPVSDYREFPVPPELLSYFLCFWTQTILGGSQRYVRRVLPDGCVDIVFINNEPPVLVDPWTEPLGNDLDVTIKRYRRDSDDQDGARESFFPPCGHGVAPFGRAARRDSANSRRSELAFGLSPGWTKKSYCRRSLP